MSRSRRHLLFTAAVAALLTGMPMALAEAPAGSASPGNVVVLRGTAGDCREFTMPIIIEGKTAQGYGRACLQPDGSWRVTQSVPGHMPGESYVVPPAPLSAAPPPPPPPEMAPSYAYGYPYPYYAAPYPDYVGYPPWWWASGGGAFLFFGGGFHHHRFHDHDHDRGEHHEHHGGFHHHH
ncbi:MAG TPA: hypothetical protein VKY65_13120 [Alphaproteobacteria bacterium]|nr:hypothetical protein [Alphaproteobacteria bacterium]